MSDDVQNAYRFLVTLDPFDAFVPRELIAAALEAAPGAFNACSGLGGELEVTSYAEGGRNDYVHQLPVRHSWGRITLSKGIARDPILFAWYEAGLFGSLGARRDGAIIMQTPEGIPTMIWTFTGGLAASWTGPEFDAQQDGLAVERLEIAHQGIKAVPGPAALGIA
ncbi:MAG: phage tail protein [Candidatus Thiodiazotropha sp.]